MARAASKSKKEISMEEALWKSADKLRGSVEPAEYKHVVLSLFFLKFASDKFEAQRKAISEKYGEKFVDNVAFYTKDNVFFLPEISRWSFIMENAKQDDIALKIDTALYTIEKANPALKGALPDNYYSRLHIDTAKLRFWRYVRAVNEVRGGTSRQQEEGLYLWSGIYKHDVQAVQNESGYSRHLCKPRRNSSEYIHQ